MTPKQLEDQLKADQKLAVRTFRLSYMTAADAKILIAPAMSSDGTVALTPAPAIGISSSKTDTGGNSHANDDILIVKDYEENLRRVESILKDVDVKPEQVLIEATILRATLTEKNSAGFDFNTLSGINFETLNSTTSGIQNVATGSLGPTGLPGQGAASTVRTDFNSTLDKGGLTFGILANNYGFFLRALEAITPVTVMANPKLLVVNKQRGEVLVGDRKGYLTTTVTETVATQTVQFMETGTRLIVRPFIGKNGNIRLEIHPEDSSGTTQTVGDNVVPSQTTTEVTSNVLVRDGHTIVIGGLFREQTTINRSQVPVAGNVPYLGSLFRSTVDSTVREEVIILLTPRIIRQETDEAVSEQLKDEVERFRIGARKGLRWWGRERLAVMFLRQARQDLEEGKRQQAMWNLDLVLSMSPQMEEAIHLKENLTETAYWSDESRYSAAQYVVQRMIMTELGKPYQQVATPQKPLNTARLAPDVRSALDIVPEIRDPLPSPPPLFIIRPKTQLKSAPSPVDANSGRLPATQPSDGG